MKNGRRWKKQGALLAVMVFFFGIVSSPIVYTATQLEAVTEFDSTKNLSTNSGASVDPEISASGNNVYVVWSDNTPGNNEIMFGASADGGKTFSTRSEGRITYTSAASLTPKVSSSGNDVYVVWIEKDSSGKDDVHFRASHDSGSSFGDIENISNSGTAAEAQVAAAGNTVYVAWSGEEILLRVSGNGSNEFGSVKNLSNNDGSSDNPEIAASGSSVYVTWTDNTPGNVEVFFAASTSSSSSFGSAVNLSNTPGTSYRAQIAASGEKVYVTWRDTPREVYVRASENAGLTFSESINLSNDETDSGWPGISAAGDNNVYLIWRAGPLEGLSKEVYIRTSENSGDSFDEVINLSNNPGNSGPPQVTSGSGRDVYVVWSDTTTGSGDIYFKSGS